MVKILNEIWKMHKRGIIASLVIIFLFFTLIYFSNIQGRFIWLPFFVRSAYDVLTPEFTIYSIVASFVVLLLIFIFFYMKSR